MPNIATATMIFYVLFTLTALLAEFVAESLILHEPARLPTILQQQPNTQDNSQRRALGTVSKEELLQTTKHARTPSRLD
jgi:hypothetical protein